MKRKIVFLDIDGTLTEPGSNTPPESALAAIRRARENGHYVILATGRNYGMLKAVYDYGFDGFISCAGGYIEVGGEPIFDCPMSSEQRDGLMELLKKGGVFRTIEGKLGTYTDESLKEFLNNGIKSEVNSELLRWREQLEKNLKILPMSAYDGEEIYKIIVMCKEKKQLDPAREKYENDFSFCLQETDKFGFVNGELINRSFDKGQALRRVSEHLGIAVADTIAFGDSMNDMELLREAGYGICMANGSRSLQEIADMLCPTVYEDGIAKSFSQLGLLD